MKIDPGVNTPWGLKYHMTPVFFFYQSQVHNTNEGLQHYKYRYRYIQLILDKFGRQ